MITKLTDSLIAVEVSEDAKDITISKDGNRYFSYTHSKLDRDLDGAQIITLPKENTLY